MGCSGMVETDVYGTSRSAITGVICSLVENNSGAAYWELNLFQVVCPDPGFRVKSQYLYNPEF